MPAYKKAHQWTLLEALFLTSDTCERSLEKVGGTSLGMFQPHLLCLRKSWKAFQSDDRKGSHTFLVPPGKRCLAQPGFRGLEFVSCVRQLPDRYCQPSDDKWSAVSGIYKVAKPRKE